MNIDKEKFEEGLKGLLDGFVKRENKGTTELIKNALATLQESGYKINNPEDFNIFIVNRIQRGLKLISKNYHKAPNDSVNESKIDFIFIHYDFLEQNIRKLCIMKEGSACCADKSRHIINMFLQYAITCEIPPFNPDKEQYWIPNFGNNEMWIKLCESLYNLYYGDPKKYLKAYSSLIESDVRKFKHILHEWFIEYKNGEVFEVAKTWDENTNIPLSVENDCYIILDKYKGTNETEKYEPKDEEMKFLYKNYVKIKKDKISRIYKKDKEIMC